MANCRHRLVPSLVALLRWTLPALAATLSSAPVVLWAQDAPLPPISIRAGAQTSFTHDSPDGGTATDRFALRTVRIYINGSATKNVKFTFNVGHDPATSHLTVLDAVMRFESSSMMNIWVGRMLTPSDRANLYGPYNAHSWASFADGVQNGYPSIAVGRDNGIAYWGQFGQMKVQAGAYDGPSVTGKTSVIGAGRVQFDFWDPEPGYYAVSTFYGAKNILAVGGAAQVQDGNKAYTGDFLLERKTPGGGAVSIEAEYAKYVRFGGYNARYRLDEGGYLQTSYLLPRVNGLNGRFELLGKFAKASFSEGITAADGDYDQKTTELNLNYIIKGFDARVMLFYLQKNFSGVLTNDKQVGVGFQVQM